MPHHSHTGDQITVVLEGSFSDEDRIYRKGDFILRDSRDRHKPIVSPKCECICLMVLAGPIGAAHAAYAGIDSSGARRVSEEPWSRRALFLVRLRPMAY